MKTEPPGCSEISTNSARHQQGPLAYLVPRLDAFTRHSAVSGCCFTGGVFVSNVETGFFVQGVGGGGGLGGLEGLGGGEGV